jgi:hypothetical protein
VAVYAPLAFVVAIAGAIVPQVLGEIANSTWSLGTGAFPLPWVTVPLNADVVLPFAGTEAGWAAIVKVTAARAGDDC